VKKFKFNEEIIETTVKHLMLHQTCLRITPILTRIISICHQVMSFLDVEAGGTACLRITPILTRIISICHQVMSFLDVEAGGTALFHPVGALGNL
jgi:flagellin-specific chaperone FliS